MHRFMNIIVLVAILAPLALAAGCSSNPGQSAASHDNLKMAAASSLPQEMQSAPTTVRESYQFAVANADALKTVPCYCGCKNVGHTSNYSCFIKEAKSDGTYVFDHHALGCSLCVDIAQEVMKQTQAGKSSQQIRADVVSTFSQYGPPNQ